MKARPTPNRAICAGDRDRSGPTPPSSMEFIRAKVASWTDPFLTKFAGFSKSEPWKRAALAEIARRDTQRKKTTRNSTRTPVPKSQDVTDPAPP